MKSITRVAIGVAIIFLIPFIASAQAVNTSASLQQSFLSELQSLQQELASLQATISAMITAAGGTTSSAPAPASAIVSPKTSFSVLPNITPATLGASLNVPSDFSGDFSSTLMQAITADAPTTTFSVLVSKVAATTSNPAASVSDQNSIANQLDPSCLSSLFANNAQCGGLYYCSAGTAFGYWSATACTTAN